MDIYELAELLHKHLCRWNHIDGCAWHYRGNDETRWYRYDEHKRYLRFAKSVVERTDMPIEDIAKVLEVLELNK
jgi:hypothetical protein